MTVNVLGWTGEPIPGGGRALQAFVDDTRVTVRRHPDDGRVTWACRQHGESTNRPTCPHTHALAAAEAPMEKRKNR